MTAGENECPIGWGCVCYEPECAAFRRSMPYFLFVLCEVFLALPTTRFPFWASAVCTELEFWGCGCLLRSAVLMGFKFSSFLDLENCGM